MPVVKAHNGCDCGEVLAILTTMQGELDAQRHALLGDPYQPGSGLCNQMTATRNDIAQLRAEMKHLKKTHTASATIGSVIGGFVGAVGTFFTTKGH